MNPVIVTGCTSAFEQAFVKSFLRTLRGLAAFTGDVLFYDYGCTKRSLAEMRNLGCKVMPVRWMSRRFLRNPWHPSVLVAMNAWGTHVANDLERTPYTHVLCIDAGDVWFQRSLDDLWSIVDDAVAMYPEPQRTDHDWFQNRLSKMNKRPTVLPGPVYNGGVIAGQRLLMIEHLRAVWSHMSPTDRRLFGVDQIWHTHVMQAGTVKSVDLPFVYNCIPGWVALPNLNRETRILSTADGIVPVVLHNAGHRLIPRVVDGKDLNVGNFFAR